MRRFLCFTLVLGASQAALSPCARAQSSLAPRWEVGAGAFATVDGGASGAAPEVYLRFRTMPGLSVGVAVARVVARLDTEHALVEERRWYDRTRLQADLGPRVIYFPSRRTQLTAAAGLSVASRDDIHLVQAYYPSIFQGSPGKLEAYMRDCEARPECTYRHYTLPEDSRFTGGDFLAIGQRRKDVAIGPFVEVEYGVNVGPVRAAAQASVRSYGRTFGLNGGVRLGTRF